jgi:hypothetical protein
MRRNQVAFQLVGSALAIACAMSLAIALSGCAVDVAEWHDPPASTSDDLDFLTSGLRRVASVAGLAGPLSRTEEQEAIIARAIAEHEARNP